MCDSLNVSCEFAKMMFVSGRNYGKFETCIASLKPICSKTHMGVIEASGRTFSFLCDKKNLDGNDRDNDFGGDINQYIPMHPT